MRTLTTAALALCALLLVATSASAQSADKPVVLAPVAAKPSVNLNAATLDQLETLPGVGRRTAERIVEYRQKSGGFKKIEELMNVKGIGEKSFLKLKPLVFVAQKPDKAGGAQ